MYSNAENGSARAFLDILRDSSSILFYQHSVVCDVSHVHSGIYALYFFRADGIY